MARILLIDDDDDLAGFLQDELVGAGHTVDRLDRAEPGPDLLQTARPPFRLVLLDIGLPGMSGIEFLQTLKDRSVQVPVVLVTGEDTSERFIEASQLGAHDYLVKPETYQELALKLAPIIRKVLRLTELPAAVPLPEAVHRPGTGPALVGRSDVMRDVYQLIGQFAASDRPVLVRGETGTGKELVARALWTHSRRKDKPFIPINCAAIPENLLEAELFGHEKGAFNGADKLRKGTFELADGGTVFLDEIGDMSAHLQAKLLRVLQEKTFQRVGGSVQMRVDVRVLSATHVDLEAAIERKAFRADLFYRLNGVAIRLPALRDRLDDLPKLAAYFLARAAEEQGRSPPPVSPAALDRLRAHCWPGNVRELENVMQRALGVCRGPAILPEHLEFPADRLTTDGPAAGSEADAVAGLHRAIEWAWASGQTDLWPLLHDLLERELLRSALARTGGTKTKVAELLNMNRQTVDKRMEKYGLK